MNEPTSWKARIRRQSTLAGAKTGHILVMCPARRAVMTILSRGDMVSRVILRLLTAVDNF
jgi:hypothetical protein